MVSGARQGDLSCCWRRQVACPNKLALVTFQQQREGGRSDLSLKPGPACFHKPKEDRQLIGRSRNLKNKSYTSTSNTTTFTHTYIRNYAARRQETQDPQDKRKSRRLNFIRFRFSPGIPHRLPQAQSAARGTWTRAGAKKGEGGDRAGEKRGAHTILLKISDQRANMLT